MSLPPLPKGMYMLCDIPQRAPLNECTFGCGWAEMDELFKFYPGQFVVVTGKAGAGKSTFMLNVLVNLAHKEGITSFLYVPENEQSLREKLRLLFPHDDASYEYLIRTKFVIQTSIRDDEFPVHTMPWIIDRAAQVMDSHKVELIYLDPWNEIDRAKPKDMMLTDYIGECIMDIKDFCRSRGATVIVCAHPTKAVNENGGRLAHLYDIEGSMNWYNKCDNGLIVVRDEGNKARVISAKVRESPAAGRIGTCYFQVDPDTGIFQPQYGAVTT